MILRAVGSLLKKLTCTQVSVARRKWLVFTRRMRKKKNLLVSVARGEWVDFVPQARKIFAPLPSQDSLTCNKEGSE